jgi:hypothetical protein
MPATSSGSVASFRRRDATSAFDRAAGSAQNLLQGRENLEDAIGSAVVAHEANTPGFALVFSQPSTDLDAKVCQESLSRCQVVNSGRYANSIQLW